MSRSRGTTFTMMSFDIDGEYENLKKEFCKYSMQFYAICHCFRDINVINDPEKVVQGHGVQLS